MNQQDKLQASTSLGFAVAGLWFLHACLWTLLPWMASYSLPLDVVEGLFWGKEWQWGYYKHPPLPAWLVHLSWQLFADLGPFLLSQLNILLTAFFAWRLGRRLLSTQQALLGTLLLMGVYYFTWPTLEYNHNVAQMPIWAAAIFFFHRGITHWRYLDWFALGVCVGLGLLTKYVIVVLVATFFIYMLVQTPLRKRIFSGQVMLAILVLSLVFSPHLYWLVQHDFLPLTYMQDRANTTSALQAHVVGPLKFIAVQLLDHVFILLLLAAMGLLGRRYWSVKPEHEALRFLLWAGLGPALLTTLVAMMTGTGLRDMWGTPMWSVSGLLVAFFLPKSFTSAQASRILKTFTVFILVLPLLRLLDLAIIPYLKDKPSRIHWPDKAIAVELERAWEQKTSCPLTLVVGDYWLAGLVSLRVPSRPSVLIEGQFRYSPWVTLDDVQQQGAVFVWRGGVAQAPNHEWMSALAGLKHHAGQVALEWPGIQAEPLQLSWIMMLPESGCYAFDDK